MSDEDDDIRDPIKRRAMMERFMREGIGDEEVSPEALTEWNAMMEWMIGVQNAIDDAPERIRNTYFRRFDKIGAALCRDLGVDAPDSERRGRVIMTLLAYYEDDDDDEDAEAPLSPSGEVVPV